MHWYQGCTLIEALDDFKLPETNLDSKPLRIVVQGGNHRTEQHGEYSHTCRVISGTLMPATYQQISSLDNKYMKMIDKLKGPYGQLLDCAKTGDLVRL